MYIDVNKIVGERGKLPTSAVTGVKMPRGAEIAFISAKDDAVKVDGKSGRIVYHTNSRIFIEREFIGDKTVIIPAGNPLESDKTAPVSMRVTLNWMSSTTWATRLILMDYGFVPQTACTFTICNGCGSLYRFVKSNLGLDILGVELVDSLAPDKPYKGKWKDAEALRKWIDEARRRWHNSAIIKPTK